MKLAGTKSNRDGIGAVVRVRSGGAAQWQMVRSGSSYCSQSELVLTFGLGRAARVDSLEVLWPSSQRQNWSNLEPNHSLLIEEGKAAVVKLER